MKIEFCKRVNGKGLFSTEKYNKGDIIYILKGPIKNKPDKYSIEIGLDQHITDEFGIYMNHSFEPSTRIDGKKVIAVRTININDELNFNYNESETNMANPFETEQGYVGGSSVKSELLLT